MQFRNETQVTVHICEAFINENFRKMVDLQGKGHVNINFTEEPTTILFECQVSIPPYTSVQSYVTVIQG